MPQEEYSSGPALGCHSRPQSFGGDLRTIRGCSWRAPEQPPRPTALLGGSNQAWEGHECPGLLHSLRCSRNPALWSPRAGLFLPLHHGMGPPLPASAGRPPRLKEGGRSLPASKERLAQAETQPGCLFQCNSARPLHTTHVQGRLGLPWAFCFHGFTFLLNFSLRT